MKVLTEDSAFFQASCSFTDFESIVIDFYFIIAGAEIGLADG
jgi:hypothetical protein